jgi:ribosomal protein S18 acetylase RimI-like enzyme
MNVVKNCMSISFSDPSECLSISRIIKSGFSADHLKYFIYGYSGIVSFIRNQINVQDIGGDTLYFSCHLKAKDKKLIGVAVIRKIDSDSFNLNYISILKDYRGRGIGKKIISFLIKYLNKKNAKYLTLDVFDSNKSAILFYEMLGFKLLNEMKSKWYIVNSNSIAVRKKYIIDISNYPEAESSQKLFGFSGFVLRSNENKYTIGRLGDSIIRLTDSLILEDSNAMSGLLHIAKKRKILLISAFDIPQKYIKYVILSSSRYSLKLNGVKK